MKFFLGIVVLSVLGSGVFSQDPSGNPLQDAYYVINSYHRMYEGTKDNVRFYMSDTSKTIIDELVQIVTNEIGRWNGRKQTCANLTPRNTEAIGNALRDCAWNAADALYDIHNNVYAELEDMQEESLSLQFSVMHRLRNFDILANYNDFYDDFQNVVDQAYDRLEHHFIPRLEAALEPLFAAETTLAPQTQTCVNAISRQFSALC
ncbi:hypothetical protein DMENIID0001_075130 [Sergentomyia squamirostris]